VQAPVRTILDQNAAEGIHRIEDAHTNWYIVQDGNRLTVVDTGLPRSWQSLQRALRELGRSASDIEAVVLTHAHFDHMGFALRAQRELGVPVWAHELERELVAHPWRYDHERSRVPYLRHPAFAKILAEMTAMGALWVKGSDSARAYGDRERLDVPGNPQVIFTPGHTPGHSSLLFADRNAVIVGDAFVMLDPYTGRPGPRIVAGAATADSTAALSSLDALADLDARIALTGHGPAWTGPIAQAAESAKAAGAS
jgi:glyoxylase-like metal-dependent hydrolase (beta-lactamase superfamily II)